MIKTIRTENAPLPGGHFSQGKVLGNILYTCGQIGQTVSKEMIQETIEEETRQCMRNLSEVALAAGTNLENTLKTTIFITDIQDFAKINSAYAEFFPNDPPARSTVQISKLAIGARVEIEAVIAIL